MDGYTLSGSFTVTIGYGDGPRLIMSVSANRSDGGTVIYPPARGFLGLELELQNKDELGGSLVGLGPTAFAVVADDGQGRGQAVITGSTVIAPQVWWQAAEQRPPER